MAYPGTLSDIGYKDSLALDPSGRLRVSPLRVIFRSTNTSRRDVSTPPVEPLWSTATANGGTVTINTLANYATDLNCVNTVGSETTRQTRQSFNYGMGRGFLARMNFALNPSDQTGYLRQIGLFLGDAPVFSGVYLQQDEAKAITLQIRTPTLNTTVAQAAWNKDPLDGSGPSGITIDFTLMQSMWIDLTGTGNRIRIGFSLEGNEICVHEFLFNNVVTGVAGQRNFFAHGNLPVRAHIENVDGVGAPTPTILRMAGAEVSVEGPELPGIAGTYSVATAVTCPVGNSTGVVAVRPRSYVTVKPTGIEILNVGANPCLAYLSFNPPLAAGGPLSFVNDQQFDNSAGVNQAGLTFANNASGTTYSRKFYTIASLLVPAGESRRVEIPDSMLGLGLSTDGTVVDYLVLSARGLGGPTDVYGSISWLEIW